MSISLSERMFSYFEWLKMYLRKYHERNKYVLFKFNK